MNLSCPCVAIPTCQPNNVSGLFVPKSPCVAQNMFPILFQGDVAVSEIMCGGGIWHIDWCLPNFVVQCFALQKNIGVKCTDKIKTHKTTFETLVPCYFGFWA